MVHIVSKKKDKNKSRAKSLIFCLGEIMEKKEEKKKSWIREFLPYIIVFILVVLIKQFIVTPVMVDGHSMDKTLQDRDIMILNRLKYKFDEIKRFDIIVIYDHDTYIIKRVIGLPGEKVEYKDNKLYVNGKYIKEDFNHAKTEDFNITTLGKKKVPKDTYFVLGDNRVDSLDSRYLGFISEKEILGKTTFTIMPFSRFGKKD